MSCGYLGRWAGSGGQCEHSVLVVAGGELDGQGLNTVEVYGSQQLLASLPEALKWGSLGFVGRRLMMCGGQNRLYQSSACWALDTSVDHWKLQGNLTRSGYTVSVVQIKSNSHHLQLI